jgi:hypothetical protein
MKYLARTAGLAMGILHELRMPLLFLAGWVVGRVH